MQRFDEIVLEPVPLIQEMEPVPVPRTLHPAPRFRRLLAFVTDASLFVALTLALSPALPLARNTVAIAALAGFVFLTSFYYYVGTWLLWGKTIGGAIFDVKVIGMAKASMSFRSAALRWTGLYLSLLSGGLGFLLAVLPSGRSLADRISRTRCIAVI